MGTKAFGLDGQGGVRIVDPHSHMVGVPGRLGGVRIVDPHSCIVGVPAWSACIVGSPLEMNTRSSDAHWSDSLSVSVAPLQSISVQPL